MPKCGLLIDLAQVLLKRAGLNFDRDQPAIDDLFPSPFVRGRFLDIHCKSARKPGDENGGDWDFAEDRNDRHKPRKTRMTQKGRQRAAADWRG